MPYKDIKSRREASRRHYINHKESYFLKKKKHSQEIRAYVRKVKNKPCKDCGKSYPHYVMDFDHVRGKKVDIISRMSRRGASLETLKKEIKKCDLVCANCHRKRTFNEKKET